MVNPMRDLNWLSEKMRNKKNKKKNSIVMKTERRGFFFLDILRADDERVRITIPAVNINLGFPNSFRLERKIKEILDRFSFFNIAPFKFRETN